VNGPISISSAEAVTVMLMWTAPILRW
jgi:hypothetical protein